MSFKSYFWLSATFSFVFMVLGLVLHAIWGMLFLIFCVLLAGLETYISRSSDE